jgi:hypothetical protein
VALVYARPGGKSRTAFTDGGVRACNRSAFRRVVGRRTPASAFGTSAHGLTRTTSSRRAVRRPGYGRTGNTSPKPFAAGRRSREPSDDNGDPPHRRSSRKFHPRPIDAPRQGNGIRRAKASGYSQQPQRLFRPTTRGRLQSRPLVEQGPQATRPAKVKLTIGTGAGPPSPPVASASRE